MSETGWQPRDHSARSDIITSVGENRCVEAGAGTGKTTVLVDRIVHALRRTDVKVQEMVVITFTERAAAELSAEERAALRVTLLDLDPRALEESRERLSTWLSPDQVRAVRENLYRLPQRPTAGELLDADLISCTGFFDYLNETDASALMRQFWKSLRPGGRLLVFNFAPQNASRALMEWIGNWYLVYRDEPEMFALADAAGIPRDSLSIGFEPAAAALYIDARKN